VPRVSGWPPAIVTAVPAADRKRADVAGIVEFVEGFGRQVKDTVAGRSGDPLVLRPWQRHLLEHVYARRSDGRLRARTALVMLPRKNGKSAIGSSLALHALFTGPAGGEVYSCATDREQARIVFGVAKRMIELDPELSAATKLYRDAIEDLERGSVYRVLSSEAFTKEGLSPSFVVYDELAQAPNDELFNVMSLGAGARVDPLLLAITTAGPMADTTGRDSTCYRLWQYGKQVAAGEIDDPSFFMAYWGADGTVDDPKVWRRGNPAFGDLVDPEDFASAVKRTPEPEFRTKRLNAWVAGQQAWLPHGAWERCASPGPLPDDGAEIVVGFDGSYAGDSTALVGCTLEGRLFVIGAWERADDDVPHWRVDIGEVEQTIREACRRWHVLEVACDPFRWQRSLEALADEGFPMVEWPTSSPARMVPACAKFYDATMDGRLTHDGDRRLGRHVDNCVLKIDGKGPRVTKDHRGSPRKIDLAVAAIVAFDRATVVREQQPDLVMPGFFAV